MNYTFSNDSIRQIFNGKVKVKDKVFIAYHITLGVQVPIAQMSASINMAPDVAASFFNT